MKKIFFLLFLCSVFSTAIAENIYAKISTSEGEIYLELFQDQTPKTVENFVQYAKDGFYTGTVFHRVISTFMIQGGGFDKDMQRKETRDPIKNEANKDLKNIRGTIAMARTSDPHSATSQFFINVQDNPALDYTGEQNTRTWGYAVFGKVIKGMDVVDEIRFKQTGAKIPFRKDVPVETVLINSVDILNEKPETK